MWGKDLTNHNAGMEKTRSDWLILLTYDFLAFIERIRIKRYFATVNRIFECAP